MVDSHTRQLYESIGAGQRVGFGSRPALIVIDFVRGMTDPKSPLGFDLDAFVEATAKVLSAARQARIPIFHTALVYEKGLRDAGLFARKVPGLKIFETGSPWSEFDERVKPASGEYVLIKKYQSAFFGTTLASSLMVEGVDTLLVTGCYSSGCIRHTVFDSMAHGLRTIVVRECVAGRSPQLHEANLFDMDNLNADVVSLQDALEYLAGISPNRV